MSKDPWENPRDFFGPYMRTGFPPFRHFRHMLGGVRFKEGMDDITAIVPLPGYGKEDIDLRVGPDTIVIGFKQKESAEEKETTGGAEGWRGPGFGPWWFFAGPLSGSVRRIPLPVEVDPDTAKAKLENGILKVTVEKKSPENEKNVEVE